jgi:hypothetical protein
MPVQVTYLGIYVQGVPSGVRTFTGVVCFITNCREGKPLACIKDHLDCARWRIPSS